MKKRRFLVRLAAPALAVALLGAASSPLLAAQPKNPAPPGDGYGGWGMGPGMMGGYGFGPGMMGGYGMGPGMMGGYGGYGGYGGWGYGMGPGMMGGHGWGWGRGLGLSDEQRARINKIQDENRKSHWALAGELMDQQARLRDLYEAPQRDQTAIDETYKAIGQLQQRMYDSSVDAQKRIEAVLTKEQQEKLRSFWGRGAAPGK